MWRSERNLIQQHLRGEPNRIINETPCHRTRDRSGRSKVSDLGTDRCIDIKGLDSEVRGREDEDDTIIMILGVFISIWTMGGFWECMYCIPKAKSTDIL